MISSFTTASAWLHATLHITDCAAKNNCCNHQGVLLHNTGLSVCSALVWISSDLALKQSALMFKLPAMKSPRTLLERFFWVLMVPTAKCQLFLTCPATFTKSWVFSHTYWFKVHYQDWMFTQPLTNGHHPPFPHFTQKLQVPESHYNGTVSSPFSDVSMLSRQSYLVSGCKCHKVEQEVAAACKLSKENGGIQHTQNITVTDPLDTGHTNGVPPPELCQPNDPESPPVQTLCDIISKATRSVSCPPRSPGQGWDWGLHWAAPASQGTSRDLNREKELFLEGRIHKY